MGLWHESTLNFLVYGLYHGFFLILEALFETPIRKLMKKHGFDYQNRGYVILKTIITFSLVTFGYVFFVTNSIQASFSLISSIFSTNNILLLFGDALCENGLPVFTILVFLISSLFLLIVQGILKPKSNLTLRCQSNSGAKLSLVIVTLVIVSLSWLILYESGDSVSQFVYFQF